MLARLILGKLLVNRIDAIHRFRPFFGKSGETWYGKRACPCCFLEHDILVLDAEWHCVFDCSGFDEICMKMPYFFKCLQEIRNNLEYAEIRDLGNLMSAIQKDYRLGFSTVSFIRRAISEGEFYEGLLLCAGPPLCLSGSLDPRFTAAFALPSGASR